MACGGCAKRQARKNAASRPIKNAADVKGGYKYLTNQQLRARLEVYKKRNQVCRECEDRYKCDYGKFESCKKHLGK